MIRLLLILWPALLPALFYAVWCVWRYRRKQAGHAVPPVTKRLFLTVGATIGIAALCFVLLGAEQAANSGQGYRPAHFKDGVLVPGKFGE